MHSIANKQKKKKNSMPIKNQIAKQTWSFLDNKTGAKTDTKSGTKKEEKVGAKKGKLRKTAKGNVFTSHLIIIKVSAIFYCNRQASWIIKKKRERLQLVRITSHYPVICMLTSLKLMLPFPIVKHCQQFPFTDNGSILKVTSGLQLSANTGS